jgi:hypothetical protein
MKCLGYRCSGLTIDEVPWLPMQWLDDHCNALAIDAVHYIDAVLPALVPCLPTQLTQCTAYEKALPCLPTQLTQRTAYEKAAPFLRTQCTVT